GVAVPSGGGLYPRTRVRSQCWGGYRHLAPRPRREVRDSDQRKPGGVSDRPQRGQDVHQVTRVRRYTERRTQRGVVGNCDSKAESEEGVKQPCEVGEVTVQSLIRRAGNEG